MSVDPVSGNPVPIGVEPENVRDDIDAKLSVGEYVVPAQAVQFHGVDKFEKLVKSAEKGMADMQANGRVGGEPVALEDEVAQAFAHGGMVGDLDGLITKVRAAVESDPSLRESLQRKGIAFAEGGFVPGAWTPPGITYFQDSSAVGSGTGVEYRIFTNAEGHRISIPFTNGEPQIPVPPGYFPEGQAPESQARGGRDAYPAEESYQGPHDWLFNLPDEYLVGVIDGEYDHMLKFIMDLDETKAKAMGIAGERGLDVGGGTTQRGYASYSDPRMEERGRTTGGGTTQRGYAPEGTVAPSRDNTTFRDVPDDVAPYSLGVVPESERQYPSPAGGDLTGKYGHSTSDQDYMGYSTGYPVGEVTSGIKDSDITTTGDYSYSGSRRWSKGGFVKRPKK